MSNSERVTVNAILDRFERDSLPSRGERTQKDYRRHLVVLRRVFGEMDANALRPKDFAEFLNVKKGPIQRVRQLAVLSAAFRDAVSRWFVLERNVLKDVQRPKSKPRDRLIEDHEFAAVMALAPIRVKLMMRLALKIGQRQGDLLNLKWADIKAMEIHIYQSKTGKRLAIEIDSELEKLLDECWKLPHGGREYVVPTRNGTRYTSEGFRACWQRVMRKWMRGGGENFHFHDIRALCATKCPNPEYAMRLLGHTTLQMTLRVYRRGIERVKALPAP
jgi:integrase